VPGVSTGRVAIEARRAMAETAAPWCPSGRWPFRPASSHPRRLHGLLEPDDDEETDTAAIAAIGSAPVGAALPACAPGPNPWPRWRPSPRWDNLPYLGRGPRHRGRRTLRTAAPARVREAPTSHDSAVWPTRLLCHHHRTGHHRPVGLRFLSGHRRSVVLLAIRAPARATSHRHGHRRLANKGRGCVYVPPPSS